MVNVLGQILETFVQKTEEQTIVDGPTARRMGRLLKNMQVTVRNRFVSVPYHGY